MEDYIVRVYRRKEENGGLFGVVEEVGKEGKRTFRSTEELAGILRVGKLGDRAEAESIGIAIPITVEGKDDSGTPFTEETVIEDLSPREAGFRLGTRVVEGGELTLVIETASRRQRKQARVASVAEGPERRTVEVVFP